jgi:hypothetical protein
VLNSYGKKVTVCQGRGAGVFCAVMGSGFLQAGGCGAKKAGVTVCGKMLKTRAAVRLCNGGLCERYRQGGREGLAPLAWP